MNSRARHPEVVALTLIVLLLGVGASPGRVLVPLDSSDCRAVEFASRLLERAVEIEVRFAERLAETLERLGSRIESRLVLPVISITCSR